MVTTEQIKELRERTGISIGECKKALEEAGGDMDKALAVLKERGAQVAEKKSSRELKAGAVKAYIHAGGTLGALVEIHSETDFVAKNKDFQTLAEEVAMHVAAMNPKDVVELLEQPFVKDPGMTVNDLVQSYIQKFGERIDVVRFTRYSTSDGE